MLLGKKQRGANEMVTEATRGGEQTIANRQESTSRNIDQNRGTQLNRTPTTAWLTMTASSGEFLPLRQHIKAPKHINNMKTAPPTGRRDERRGKSGFGRQLGGVEGGVFVVTDVFVPSTCWDKATS